MSKKFPYQINHEFSVRSGILTVACDKVGIALNEYGEYEYAGAKQLNKEELAKIELVDSMSDASPNEDEIGKELYGKVASIKHDDILGYYSDLCIGHVTEGDYRKNGTSGGFATWILAQLFEEGKIDAVIHLKPSNDGDGILFKYQISRTKKAITESTRSRYYPGELSKALAEVKKTPGKYAIVGIPSFIMEVRLLQKIDPIFAKRIKYAIGIFCGHQKSTKYAEMFAWQAGIKPGNLETIDFRKKILGSPANEQHMEFTYNKNITKTRSLGDFFGGDWGKGMFKTTFSDFTDDPFNETADVTLGDAWLPEYVKDPDGNNIVVVRHPDIAKLIKDGTKKGKIHIDTVDEKTIIRSQSGMIHHMRDELPYRLWKLDQKGVWRPNKRVKASRDIPVNKRRVQDLREKFRDRSRIEYLEAVKRKDFNYFVKKMKPLVFQYTLLYTPAKLKKLGFKGALRKIGKKIVR